MSTVLIPMAAGFEEIEAVVIIDVLRRAGIEVMMASVDGASEVAGAHGIVMKCDRALEGISESDIDMIVLPGGWGGTKVLATDAKVQALLKAMDAKEKLIGAICAAPFALDKAGVLKPNFTCYPSVEDEIDLEGYQGDAAQVVEAGHVITSRGPGTAICFALAIVKKLCGAKSYEQIRDGLLAPFCEE